MNSRQGFTLIELLVVISIISLFASIVFSKVNDARKVARYRVITTELNNISTLAQDYHQQFGNYGPRFDITAYETCNTGSSSTLFDWPPIRKIIQNIQSNLFSNWTIECTTRGFNDAATTSYAIQLYIRNESNGALIDWCVGNKTADSGSTFLENIFRGKGYSVRMIIPPYTDLSKQEIVCVPL